MNKKLLSLLFFSILVLSMLPKVSADYATNITSTPGAVSCIIEFDTASDSYVRIYYGESSGIDATDNMTYRDPDLCTYGERTHRKMLIRGLTEDTTYYYRLRDTEIDEWLSDELSFTTLSRFTNDTGWKDEFFDLYLVDSNSSGLVIDQQVGTKQGPFIQKNTQNETNGRGPYYCCVFNDSGTWRAYYSAQPLDLAAENATIYNSSTDGTTWSEGVIIHLPDANNNFQGCFVNLSGTFYHYFSADSSNDFRIATMNVPDGTLEYTYNSPVFDSGDYGGNEFHISGVFNDTLGAQFLSGYGQYILGNPNSRMQGHKWSYNATDWVAVSETLDVPRVDEWQVYMFPAEIKSGVYVGANQQYNDTAKKNKPYLSISRNGVNWTNVDDTQEFIPLGANGEFDDSLLYANWGDLVITDGDYDYVYYSGLDGLHGQMKNGSVARVQFRKDGITALDHSAGAWFKTVEIPAWFSSNLTVNGAFSEENSLLIEVLDSEGSPLTGFKFADCDPITEDSIYIYPSWGSNNISDIPYGDFYLNFSFSGSDSELFSYTLLGDRVDEGEDNVAPTVEAVTPANGASGAGLSPNFSFTLNDINGDMMDYSYGIILEGCYQQGSAAMAVENGTYGIIENEELCYPLECGTLYSWWVNVTDDSLYTNTTFTFRTQACPTEDTIYDSIEGFGNALAIIITVAIFLAFITRWKWN